MKAHTTLGKFSLIALVVALLVSLLPLAVFAAPLAPSNLTATVQAGPQVALTWTDVAGEVGYRVMRAVAPSITFTDLTVGIGGLPANSVSFNDSAAVAGVTYSYQVVAFDLTGNSPPSNTVTITATVPAVPTALGATQQAGPPQTVTLSWTDNSDNEVGFRVERADNAGFTLNLVQNARGANVAAAPVTFIDADIIPGATYSYRVSSLSAQGASAPSNTASITVTAAAGMVAGAAVPIAGFGADSGYPLYYQDILGTKLNLLPIGPVNLADGVIAGNAYSAALGFGTEAFYYAAGADGLDIGAGAGLVEFAIEAIFTSPTGVAAPGTEAVMNRTRIRIDVPVSGDYAITTPYHNGATTLQFPGVAAGVAGFDINFTVDIFGAARDFAATTIAPAGFGLVDTFLRPTAAQPAGFLGDGLTVGTVTGAPGQPTSVTITGPGGITNTTDQWTINGRLLSAPVLPNFTKSPVTPLSVAFTDTTVGTPTSWAWDFGDGQASIEQNPVHIYATAGNFVVRLTASNSGGSATTSQMVSTFGAPSAVFTTAAGGTQLTVDFTSSATGNPTGWAWDFGDGQTSTVQNPSHVYATSGDFTVTLNVFNPGATATASQLLSVGPPNAPSAVSGAVISPTQIDVTWTDNSLSETGFRIERATDALFTLNLLSRDVAASAGTGAVTFNDTTGITINTIFFYRVFALNVTVLSAASNVAQVTVGTVPAQPTNFTATLLSGTQVRLDWTDNANNEDLYHLHRAPTADFLPGQILDTPLPANTVTFTDTVATGQTFFYFVHAMNALGESPNSVIVSVSTTLPAAPSGLTAAPLTATTARLTWTDTSNNETGFIIERASDVAGTPGVFAQVGATQPANTTTFTDTVTAGATFHYRVTATNPVGNSATPSNVAAVTMGAPAAPLIPADDLVAIPPTTGLATANANGTITVRWIDVANNEQGFRVERSAGATFSAATAILLATVNAAVEVYVDTAAAPETQYTYQVTAFNGLGVAASAPDTVTSATPLAFPVQPSGLTATAPAPNQVILNWTDGSTNEAGFRVLRNPDATGAAAFGQVGADLGVNVVTFTDTTNLVRNTAYQYQVVAFNSVGASNPTNTAQVLTPDVLPPPAATGLTAQLVGGVQVNLSWTDNSPAGADAATGFRIVRTPERAAGPATVGLVTTYQDTDLSGALGGTISYQVIALNLGGLAAASNTASVNTAPPPAAPPAGGGGGVSQPLPTPVPGVPAPVTIEIGIMGKTALAGIDITGVFVAAGSFTSPDGTVKLDIAQDTKALMADGATPLNGVNIQAVVAPAAPQGKAVVGSALNMGPLGSTFAPAATLTMPYDPAQLPAGSLEATLQMGFWDGSAWEIMASQLDTAAHTVAAAVPHFGIHAVLADLQAQPTATPVPPEPTATPVPTATPAPEPTPVATPTQAAQPTPVPTPTQAAQPTPVPTPTQAAQPTPVPTPTRAAQPTPVPTPTRAAQPTPVPTPTQAAPQPTPTTGPQPTATAVPQPTATAVPAGGGACSAPLPSGASDASWLLFGLMGPGLWAARRFRWLK